MSQNRNRVAFVSQKVIFSKNIMNDITIPNKNICKYMLIGLGILIIVVPTCSKKYYSQHSSFILMYFVAKLISTHLSNAGSLFVSYEREYLTWGYFNYYIICCNAMVPWRTYVADKWRKNCFGKSTLNISIIVF